MSENWQQRATNFAQKHNLSRPAGVYALDLVSEVGEVAKEILLATEYGERPFAARDPHTTDRLAAELGDVLYSLCLLASTAGVDLEEALTDTLQKYDARWRTSGHPGSES